MFKRKKINLSAIKKINLSTIKKLLIEKGFVIKKKKNFFHFNDLRSFYYTILSSFVIILISFFIPLSVDIGKNIKVNKSTVDNNSNLNFQKVLDGKPLKNENIDEGLDIKNLFEDIFSFEEVPTDTVRLSASTIDQLFKETNYNLDDVRKTKLVKPIRLSLLPGEKKKIESTKKKKEFVYTNCSSTNIRRK